VNRKGLDCLGERAAFLPWIPWGYKDAQGIGAIKVRLSGAHLAAVDQIYCMQVVEKNKTGRENLSVSQQQQKNVDPIKKNPFGIFHLHLCILLGGLFLISAR
jgi:hypothetical protein